MRIAILSDTRLPTHKDFAGHGLGKVVLTIAEGLLKRGHDVELFGGPGTDWTGKTHINQDEREFAIEIQMSLPFDVILDSTHQHTLQKVVQSTPIVNLSQDREGAPGKCAVFSSEAHKCEMIKRYGEGENGRVIPNGVNIDEFKPVLPNGEHFIYLSMMHTPKAPIMAWNAARLAGVKLVMAGPTPPMPPADVEYIGPVSGIDKVEFLSRAKALLFGASTEAGPVTPLEAQACGCPVIVSAYGAAEEAVVNGETGFVVRDTLEMVEAIKKIDTIDRAKVRQWAVENRSTEKMIDAYEKVLIAASQGEVW